MPYFLSLVLYLIVVALICFLFIWAIQTYLTMIPPPIRNVICFIIVVGGALSLFYGAGHHWSF